MPKESFKYVSDKDLKARARRLIGRMDQIDMNCTLRGVDYLEDPEFKRVSLEKDRILVELKARRAEQLELERGGLMKAVGLSKQAQELFRSAGEHRDRMVAILEEADGRLSDRRYDEYQRHETQFESALLDLAAELGQVPPRIDPSSTRAERLEHRWGWIEDAVRNYRRPASATGLMAGYRGAESRGGGFESIGAFCQAVARSEMPGQRPDERLFESRASGMQESVGSQGGFALSTDFSQVLLDRVVAEGSKLLSRCFQIPLSSAANEIKLPFVQESSRASGSRFGAINLFWTAEAATFQASKPVLGEITLKPVKLTGLMYATDELLADSGALSSYIERWFVSEFGWFVDNAIVRGDGVSGPLGILNSASLIQQAKTVGQAADTVSLANLASMLGRLPASSMSSAVWLVSQSVMPQLLQLSLNANSPAVWLTGGSAAAAPQMAIFGLPLIPMEQCSALGDVGDVILADLSQYALATRGGISSASSVHVRFLFEETCFRWSWRLDGRPIPSTAVTPAYGDTISPFCTLAERA